MEIAEPRNWLEPKVVPTVAGRRRHAKATLARNGQVRVPTNMPCPARGFLTKELGITTIAATPMANLRSGATQPHVIAGIIATQHRLATKIWLETKVLATVAVRRRHAVASHARNGQARVPSIIKEHHRGILAKAWITTIAVTPTANRQFGVTQPRAASVGSHATRLLTPATRPCVAPKMLATVDVRPRRALAKLVRNGPVRVHTRTK